MLLSPLVFCCSLRGFVVFYCAMTQYNTMLCLKTHSAILYKDVTYFRFLKLEIVCKLISTSIYFAKCWGPGGEYGTCEKRKIKNWGENKNERKKRNKKRYKTT